MTDVRCVYCGCAHERRPLPYDCPECGHDLKVISRDIVPPGPEGRAFADLLALEDRRFIDTVEAVVREE